MRIGLQAFALQTADDFRKAGVARYTVRMVRAFLETAPQHEYVIFVRPTLEAPAEWTRFPNVKVVRTWPKTRSWNLVGRELEPVRHRLDAYLAFTGTLPRLSTCLRAGTVHDIFFLTHPDLYTEEDRRIHTGQGVSLIRRADLLFAVSEFTKAEVVRVLGVPPARIVVAPNGPGNDIAPLDAATAPDPGLPFRRYILTLSTVEPRKNLPRLIEAFGRLAFDPALADVGLVVGGGKGWKAEAVYETVARLGLESRVAFLGYVPDADLPSLFAHCELFALASTAEGFGIPVLEAMLAGAPVVCSNGGALPEVAGDAARYFDPLSVDSTTAALRDALEDPRPRDFWTVPALRRAQGFTWERSVGIMLEALQSRRRK